MNKYITLFIIIFLSSFLIISCTITPEPIRYGEEECAYCKMVISDNRFGAELITVKNKAYKFDSIECLAAFNLKQTVSDENTHSLWITDFDTPGKIIDINSAYFFHSEKIRSPMGLNLSAFSTEENAENAKMLFSGEIISWDSVLILVKQKWLTNR